MIRYLTLTVPNLDINYPIHTIVGLRARVFSHCHLTTVQPHPHILPLLNYVGGIPKRFRGRFPSILGYALRRPDNLASLEYHHSETVMTFRGLIPLLPFQSSSRGCVKVHSLCFMEPMVCPHLGHI